MGRDVLVFQIGESEFIFMVREFKIIVVYRAMGCEHREDMPDIARYRGCGEYAGLVED
jgi:hypothetical protein